MAKAGVATSRRTRLGQVLDDLLGNAPELQGAAVVGVDGQVLASVLPAGVDDARLSAVVVELLGYARAGVRDLGLNELTYLQVEGERGTVVVLAAGQGLLLVAIGARGVNVGLVVFELRVTAGRVLQALDAPAGPTTDRHTEAMPNLPSLPSQPQQPRPHWAKSHWPVNQR